MIFRLFLFKLIFLTLIVSGCARSLPNTDLPAQGSYVDTVNIVFRGFKRDYRIHFPDMQKAQQPLPLVIVIHGAFSSARTFEKISGFSLLADQEGFVAVYPNGIGLLGFLRHWNAGYCCGYAADNKIDDVAYLSAIIDKLLARYPIDASRIFLVGFSNGGMLAYRYASEFKRRIAGIAVVSSTIGVIHNHVNQKLPAPRSSLPVLIAHGLADDSIPFNGGSRPDSDSDLSFYSVNDSVAFWLSFNKCFNEPAISFDRQQAIELKSWKNCTNAKPVLLYSIQDWDHRWPGLYHTQKLPLDHPLVNFHLTRHIWDFFQLPAAID